MPEDFSKFSDFKRLPFITRRDLSENYPYDMFAVPLREVVRLHTASINFEDPIVIGFTQNDIKVVTGASGQTPEELVTAFLEDTLETGDNICDH